MTEHGPQSVLVIGSAGLDIKGLASGPLLPGTSNAGRVRRSLGSVARNVADTNVLVSGIVSERGAPHQIIEAWRRREFTLLTSALIIAAVVWVFWHLRIQESSRRAEGQRRS